MAEPPLKGITVVDLSRLIPGPFCSLLLSEMGARVIKVEDSGKGDYLRDLSEPLFHAFNRRKENICINLREARGREILSRLLKKADVLIESFRPGVLAGMGFSQFKLRRLNPKLLIASITGYGQTGPNRSRAGHDLNYQSLSGSLTGGEVPPIQSGDLVGGGLWGAFSIVTALLARQRKIKIKPLDISMTDSMIYMNLANIVLGQLGQKLDLLNGGIARYRIYETKDRLPVSLASLEGKFWDLFCARVGKDAWRGSKSYLDADPAIHRELEALFRTKTRQEWIDRFKADDICITPLLSAKEVAESPQFLERGLFERAVIGDHAVLFPSLPVGALAVKSKSRVARKGQQTLAILKELKYSSKETKDLIRERIVHTHQQK